MTDPCWLPSAIMQTSGALLAIFALAYTLVSQRGKPQLPIFFLCLISGGITIILSTLWLGSLTRFNSVPFYLPTLTTSLFIATVILLILTAIVTLNSLR